MVHNFFGQAVSRYANAVVVVQLPFIFGLGTFCYSWMVFLPFSRNIGSKGGAECSIKCYNNIYIFIYKTFARDCSDGMTAIADYESSLQISTLWPEFGRNGKGGITVRDVLDHKVSMRPAVAKMPLLIFS